jgi:outer membrane protein assembly factor BamB
MEFIFMKLRLLFISLITTLFNFAFAYTEPSIKWKFDTYDACYGQPAAADIDNDGKFEIVFGCYRNDSCVYALNGENGSLLWKFNAATKFGEGCNDTAPLIYDVDNDGNLDVIVASSCNPTTFCFDGLTGEVKWECRTRGSDSPPTIGDIDGDGKPEILHGEFNGYVICINPVDGTQKWEILVDSNSWVQTAPTIVDLDGDGHNDFVVATWAFDTNDKMYAYLGSDHSLLWTYNLQGNVYHGTSVSDIDNDGKPELLFGDYGGFFYALNAEDGSLLWKYESGVYCGSPASIADINGDGNCDIVCTSAYKVILLSGDGSVIWQYTIPDYEQAFRGVALADMNSDNFRDVVFSTTGGLVMALNGLSGSELWRIDLQSDYGKEFPVETAPIIADFDKDGKADVFVVGGHGEYPDFYKNYGRAYCISTESTTTDEWTMFQNNIERNGSICKLNTNVEDEIKNESTIYQYDEISGQLIINSTEKDILVYDIFGRFSKYSSYGNELRINFEIYPSGIYFIKSGNHIYKFAHIK